MGQQSRKDLVVLIPGLDGTGRLYYRHIQALSARYRVRAWAFEPRPVFDFPDLVAELDAELAAEPPGSVTIVGESFGGTVALHYTLAHQERVRRLLLINTFAEYPGRLRIALACRLAPLLSWRGVRQVKDFIVHRQLAAEGVQPEDRRRYQEIIQFVDRASYCRRLQLVRDVRLRERLGQVRVPTLIFASGKDKVVPPLLEARYMASRIPGARLLEYPHAGHALLLTPGFSLAEHL
jgi:pimeloyl-ACP methyl ester carboxylesterase